MIELLLSKSASLRVKRGENIFNKTVEKRIIILNTLSKYIPVLLNASLIEKKDANVGTVRSWQYIPVNYRGLSDYQFFLTLTNRKQSHLSEDIGT